MSRRKAAPASRVASQIAELSLAAPYVVAQRLGRFGAAGVELNSADRREFERMLTEKMIAFQQSWLATWQQSLLLQLRIVQGVQAAGWAMATGRSSKVPRKVTGSLPHETARVMSATLEPVRSKAVSNAKRLSRKRSKT